ncbi:sedoheptulose 7-phosphate cyclase [Roseofilum capinflatum]|uniref:Sedoheptulose 7-phosphate cyclase n=1 Tax=Roseofilum capinflatum BLCC-M114 TaxID=3022440 RepID=A0ABT7B5Z2_9CYAN|nr:sedoheptulose 7-phosphate cyclase [Roseofilum capinflatum]MDJ1174579.1 sedoheptulose 7-phosphate cyclase [Roseofilum capinflatum BLCC-M114]
MASPSLSNSDRPTSDRLNSSRSDSDPDLLIWRPHDSRYQTSQWYTGYGEIEQEPNRRSFTVTATYTLQAEVKIVEGVLDPTNPILANLYRECGRCISIIDQTIDELYGDELRHYFQVHQIPLELKVCRAWESDKTPETVHQLLHFLGKEGCDVSRNEPVLVMGGGVLSDVAGLACALQHRRTPYVMIGTSIVAAIDAGPSPRTCVNGELFKNSIGVYHPPVLTLVDRSFFRTLPIGHIRNGMAEIIKMAVTDDRELFELLEEYGVDLIETHFATVNADAKLEKIADEVIYHALYAYMKHEGTNMFETYQDRPHAYGHTWSPRFEPAAKLMHGHAVTIGMAFGATLAAELDWITAADRDRIIALCRTLSLSVYHPILEDTELMLAGQKNMRRKRGQGGLWAPLPQGTIGSCDYAQEVSPEQLERAITEHKAICSQFPDGGAGEQMYLSDLGLE